MKLSSSVLGALFIALPISAACAADLGGQGSYKDGAGVFETPVSGASVNWSGFYLGGGVGRNSTTHDVQGQRGESSAKFLNDASFLRHDVYAVDHPAVPAVACPAAANGCIPAKAIPAHTSYTEDKTVPGATLWKTEGSTVTTAEVDSLQGVGSPIDAKKGDQFPNGVDSKFGDALLANGGNTVGYTLDTTSFFSSDGSAKGFTGSLGLGYDKQMGSMLFGVMGDYQFRNAKTTFGDASIAQSDAIFLGARLGYLPTNKMLLYVLGGYTWLGHDSFASNMQAADDARGCNTSDKKGCSATYGDGNFGGFTIGGGAEVAVTHALFLGLESRYTMYGKETIKTSTAVDNIQHQVETISMTDEPSEWYVGATLKLKMNSDGFASLK